MLMATLNFALRVDDRSSELKTLPWNRAMECGDGTEHDRRDTRKLPEDDVS